MSDEVEELVEDCDPPPTTEEIAERFSARMDAAEAALDLWWQEGGQMNLQLHLNRLYVAHQAAPRNCPGCGEPAVVNVAAMTWSCSGDECRLASAQPDGYPIPLV